MMTIADSALAWLYLPVPRYAHAKDPHWRETIAGQEVARADLAYQLQEIALEWGLHPQQRVIERWLRGRDFSQRPGIEDLALDWLHECGVIKRGSRLSMARVAAQK